MLDCHAAPLGAHSPTLRSPPVQAPFVLCLKLLIAITWAAATCAAFAADVVPTRSVPWPSAGWQESTPEQQGMASFAVQRLVDFGAKNGMDSLLVVRHGHVVVDAYYAPFQTRPEAPYLLRHQGGAGHPGGHCRERRAPARGHPIRLAAVSRCARGQAGCAEEDHHGWALARYRVRVWTGSPWTVHPNRCATCDAAPTGVPSS